MSNTYPVSRVKNDYTKNPKNNCVDTPIWLSLFIFNIIPDQYKKGIVLDIACGNGQLSYRFENAIGIDILDFVESDSLLEKEDYLKMDYLNEHFSKTSLFNTSVKRYIKLIVCNPPFNDSSGIYKRKLIPELFFKKIISDFGPNFPFVLFVPMGFRLNQKIKSKRYKMIHDSGVEITSVLPLPINAFNDPELEKEYNEDVKKINKYFKRKKINKKERKKMIAASKKKNNIVLFHCEVLFFNMEGMKAHYFIEDKAEKK